jgi:hypothetical protein
MAASPSPSVILSPLRHPEPAKDLLARSTSVRADLGTERGDILHFVKNDVEVEDGGMPIPVRHPFPLRHPELAKSRAKRPDQREAIRTQ